MVMYFLYFFPRFGWAGSEAGWWTEDLREDDCGTRVLT
jgi:hypothetical protein